MNNAQFVENVRAICKQKGTSITKLEEKLHFGNGYIGKLATRKSSPEHNRIVSIANALEVSVYDLTGESSIDQLAGEERFAMYDGDQYEQVPEDIKQLAAAFVLAKKEQDYKNPAVKKIIEICNEHPDAVEDILLFAEALKRRSEKK